MLPLNLKTGDIVLNLSRKNVRRARHELCSAWRALLSKRGAIEVHTPVLQKYPDIAPVRQFVTAHPSTGHTTCLRIAPTEYLKRLLVDGEDQVFEFSVNFRDDEADKTHLPEFTSLEYMAIGTTYKDMEALAIQLVSEALNVLCPFVDSAEVPDWVSEFSRGYFTCVSIYDKLGVQFDAMKLMPKHERSLMADKLISDTASAIKGVVIMSGFPDFLGGPAAALNEAPGFKQRTEMYINGLEIANMSTTLTDPALLTAWHTEGIEIKRSLNISTNALDIELHDAIAKGIPGSAVIGIGVERVLQAILQITDMKMAFDNGF